MKQTERNLLDAICLSVGGYNVILAFAGNEIFRNGAYDKDCITSVIGQEKTDEIFSRQNQDKAEKILEMVSVPDIHILCRHDALYPEMLRKCPDAPFVLYVKTESDLDKVFGNLHATSIIGTRDMSPYGKSQTENIVYDISQEPDCDETIVSGLAVGIDTEVHRAALLYKLKTIAVMATGITEPVYPHYNQGLAKCIASAEGSALITPFIPGTAPMAFNFLQRNRIVAGISERTFVIESKPKGGAMVTARFAYDYERLVYAVPGRLSDERSKGCNLLIKNGIAEIFVK